MPLPFAPIAGLAVRYGAVAAASYAVARSVERGRRDQRAEDAHDDLDEGLSLRCAPGQTNATGRFRRVVRIGRTGPGLEIDVSVLGRVRIRRV